MGFFLFIIFFTRSGTTQLIFLEEMVTKLKDLERNLLNKRFSKDLVGTKRLMLVRNELRLLLIYKEP